MRFSAKLNHRAFTSLEALVMLVILFILTILLIGLAVKKDKDELSSPQDSPATLESKSSDKTSPPTKTSPEKTP